MFEPFKFSCRRGHWLALLILGTALLSGCKSTQTQPRTLRVMTYNIQHGAGADNKIDLLRTAEVIKREKPDIVALEEVDKGVDRTARRDLTSELAALTGMTGYFSNNFHFQGGEYGNAVLTRFPILMETNTHYKMIRPNEQRGVIQMILNVKGRKVVFMVTHIDYRPDDAERLINADQIREIIKHYQGMPIFLCGDFNDVPGSPTYKKMRAMFADTWELVGQGEGLTYSSIKPQNRIDYIWISPDKSIVPIKAWIPDTQASDHFPLVADFELK